MLLAKCRVCEKWGRNGWWWRHLATHQALPTGSAPGEQRLGSGLEAYCLLVLRYTGRSSILYMPLPSGLAPDTQNRQEPIGSIPALNISYGKNEAEKDTQNMRVLKTWLFTYQQGEGIWKCEKALKWTTANVLILSFPETLLRM